MSDQHVRAASDAVSRAHDWLERANEKVLKLELRCVALECKKYLQDENELKAELDRVALLVPDSPFVTTCKGKAVFDYNRTSNEQVEEKLEKAKAELKDAEGKLEKAKAELKDAEAAIEKAKSEVPAAEFAPYVNAAWSNGLLSIGSISTGVVGKAQGMTELVKTMTERLQILGSHFKSLVKFVRQLTVAFALTSSSGVGKTFFSLAVAKLLSEALKGTVGTLCLGFNSDAPLQQKEHQLLKQTLTYESVQLVLYRRLLIQLECLLAWKREPQTGTCTPFEFDEYGLQHVVQMDENDAEALASLPLLANDLDAAKRTALELLTAVQKAYKLSHLMLVIDEGQILDELIKPNASFGEGGARFALRWTRELQLAAVNGKCGLLCFGLMTGIDPQTSLRDQTTGTNYPLCHMPMTREDFKKLTKDALDEAVSSKPCDVAVSEPLIDLVAASYFPDARAVSLILFDDHSLLSLPKYQFRDLFDEATRRKLVVGALARIPIDNTDWARTIPSAWTVLGERFPSPNYSMIVSLLDTDIFSSFPTESLAVNDSFEFEALAAATLRLLIWVREEFKSLSTNQWMRRKKLMPQIFPDAAVCLRMINAFPDTIRGCSVVYPQDAKQRHYPSSVNGKHEDAFAVGESSPKLADTFKESTDKLHNAAKNGANTLFFRCGGSAPIDFVILHKRGKKTWRLTLADAKHTCKQQGSTTISAREMAAKGDMVFRYLAKQLKEEYKVTLTWDRAVLLVINARCRFAVRKYEIPPAEPVTIVRLTPSTFQMGSITEYLLARRACFAAVANASDEVSDEDD